MDAAACGVPLFPARGSTPISRDSDATRVGQVARVEEAQRETSCSSRHRGVERERDRWK